MQIDLMGIKINTETKDQVLRLLEDRFKSGQKSFIVTPYSEFFYYSAVNYKFRSALKHADISIPDGITVLWLAHYLALPFSVSNYYAKIFQGFWQMLLTLFEILFWPKKIRKIIPEKISGSDFFWDLVKFADTHRLKIYLLGGFGDTPKMVAEKISQKYPNVLIVGYSNLDPESASAELVNSSKADLVFTAYGPINSVTWIDQHLEALQAKILIGVGGTFDYIAGKKKQPPKFVREMGLEWMYRLLTQGRFKRIWIATYVFLRGTLRHKVFNSMPYRQNVVGVIINSAGKVFVAEKNFGRDTLGQTGYKTFAETQNHWMLPQGGVDPGENFEQAVRREVREETGIKKLQVLGKAAQTYCYFWPHATRPLWFNRLKFKGQEQTIYFLKYIGDDSDIELEQRELTKYQWVAKEQLKNIIHPVRQEMLGVVLKEIDKFI